MKKYVIIGILLLITLAFTFAIFYYSVEMSEDSYKRSSIVTEMIEKIIDIPENITTNETQHIIRKFAHIFEYGFLGFLISIIMIYVKNNYNKTFYGYASFFVLACSVTDEYIQRFCGRSSTVGDIVLDFFGSLLGIGITYGIYALIKFIRKVCFSKQ